VVPTRSNPSLQPYPMTTLGKTGFYRVQYSMIPPVPSNASVHSQSQNSTLELNVDVIAEILGVTHVMPSWKACQMEGMSWAGTAEENMSPPLV